MTEQPSADITTRREVLKKAAFVLPVILSLPASAAYARNGSGRRHISGYQRDEN
jgi:hypothetical protein